MASDVQRSNQSICSSLWERAKEDKYVPLFTEVQAAIGAGIGVLLIGGGTTIKIINFVTGSTETTMLGLLSSEGLIEVGVEYLKKFVPQMLPLPTAVYVAYKIFGYALR